MIKLKFEFEDDYLLIKAEDSNFNNISLISNRYWTSQSVAEDIEYTKQAKEGTLKLEDGEDYFHIGFEGSPGIIFVKNGDRAYLEPQYEDEDDYLILEFDELLDILEQMYNFLVSIGK